MKKFFLFFILSTLVFPLNNYSQNTSPPLAKGAERFINSPRLSRGPYLQVATDTSILVRWRTDALCRSRVMYGTTMGKLDNKVDDISLKMDHEIKIVGLTPGTKYYYGFGTLKDTLGIGQDYQFSTLPERGKAGIFRIGVFGDCGSRTINQVRVRDSFLNYLGSDQLNAWILLGDNAYNDGNDVEYQAGFFIPFAGMLKKYPVFPSPGNHEYHDADFTADYAQRSHSVPYYQIFSMPVNGEAGGVPSGNAAFYSFDLGNIHFISLDSYGIEQNKYMIYHEDGPQMQWLKKDLQANRNKGWIIVFFHHPPYSKGTHDSDTEDIMVLIRQNLLKVLENADVDLVICGHSHVYERSKLMRGHYGNSETFDASTYQLSGSSGMYNGNLPAAPYIKDTGNSKGIVYVVMGSSSYVGKAAYKFPHPAMYYSNDTSAGAAMLEVQDNRLDFKWICADGVIRDQFTMMKKVNRNSEIRIKKGEAVTLKASFIGSYLWSDKETSRTITVTPTKSSTFTVRDPGNFLHDRFNVIVTK